MRLRLSLTDLIAVVLLSGLLAGSIVQGNPPGLHEAWSIALSLLATASLGTAILGIVYRRGRERAFWVGFASFACCWLILGFAGLDARHYLPGLLGAMLLIAYVGGIADRSFAGTSTNDPALARPSSRATSVPRTHEMIR